MSRESGAALDVRKCTQHGYGQVCPNCEPWEGLCGRYGHTGCKEPREGTWVFCHQHRRDHVGSTEEERRADARRATWAEAIEAAAKECERCAALWLDDPVAAHLAKMIRALTPPEGGGGKETTT